VQAAGRPGQAEDDGGQLRRHRAEGLQGPGARLLHVRPLLGALLHPQHNLRRLPRLRRARARRRRLPVARLRQLYHQPHHLHGLQQDLQGGLHQAPAVQVSEVLAVRSLRRRRR
jgi:hypothetical protein